MWQSKNVVSSQLESLLAAERRLIELATSGRFDHPAPTNVDIVPFDTHIPRTVVPLKNHGYDMYPQDGQRDSYRIHALRISNAGARSSSEKETRESPIVFLHGYMNASAYFYRNFAGLSRYFDTMYSLDLLGWGLSSRPRFDPKDSNMETAEAFFVESLEAWRAKNGIGKMTLAGHSMGGYISVAYCEKYPQHVERLILISPAGVTPETEEFTEKRRARARTSLSWRLLGGFYTGIFFPNFSFGNILRAFPSWSENKFLEYMEKRIPAITDLEERTAVAKYLHLNTSLPGSGEHCLPHFLTPFAFGKNPTEFRIPNLKVPHVSFLYGKHDWMDATGALRVQATCEQKQAAPKVDVYQVSDAGHLLMLDNWREFNAGMVMSAGLEPKKNEPTPVKLHPGESFQQTNEMERTVRRMPTEPVAA